jgi:hypothetical protein
MFDIRLAFVDVQAMVGLKRGGVGHVDRPFGEVVRLVDSGVIAGY